MILELYQLAFTFPKYTLCQREIKVYKVEMKQDLFSSNKIVSLCGDYETYNFEKGNIVCRERSFVFYQTVFAGRNNQNLALKYLKYCLKNEASHSELHLKRYLKFLEDFDLK